MSGYAFLRLLHGDWRWAVLAALVVVLVRASLGLARGSGWSPGDERAARLLVIAFDVQVLLGLILYFAFSPSFSALVHAPGAAMKDAGTRFFAVEHGFAMLIALAVLHVARARSRRQAEPARKHRIMLVGALVVLVISGWAIPWPSRAVGRPLVRTSLSS